MVVPVDRRGDRLVDWGVVKGGRAGMTIASSSLVAFNVDGGGLQQRHPGMQFVHSRPAFAQVQVVFARREHLANRVHSQHL